MPAPTFGGSEGNAPPPRNGVATELSPMRITGDTELATAATTYNWSGNGSSGDPYVIEGVEIDGSGSAWCLFLDTFDAYVVVRDSWFHNTSEEHDPARFMAGLVVSHCYNITIEDCTFEDNRLNGISLWFSDALVRNNTLRANQKGIYILLCDGGSIDGNTLINNTYGVYSEGYTPILNNTITGEVWSRGIYLQRFAPTSMSGNVITGQDTGIFIHSGTGAVHDNNIIRDCREGIYINWDSVTIANSTIENCSRGIRLDDVGVTLVNNTLKRCTIVSWMRGEDAVSHTIPTSNTVDGKAVLYITNRTSVDIQPSNYGQVIVANCTNISLEDRTIEHPFWLSSWDSGNFVIEGNSIDPGEAVEWPLRYADYVSIVNNSISDVELEIYKPDPIGRHDIVNNTMDGGRILVQAMTNVTVHNNSLVAYGKYALTVYGGGDGGNVSIMDNDITLVDPDAGQYALGIGSNTMNFTLRNNSLRGAGLSTGWISSDFRYDNFDLDMSTTVNGRPILYVKSEVNRTLTGEWGQVLVIGSVNITVEYMDFVKGDGGVTMYHTDDSVVANCTFKGQVDGAVNLNYCDNVTVERNLFRGGNSILNLSSCNSYTDPPFGNVTDNYFMDLVPDPSNPGALVLRFTNLETIKRNLFANITGAGIWAKQGERAEISSNEFSNCTMTAYQGTIKWALWHHNSFIDNALGAIGAQVGTTSGYDSWTNLTGGNYWSNYEDRYPNATNDGTFWKTAYRISGSRADTRPLVNYTDRIAPLVRIDHNATAYPNTNTTFRSAAIDNQGIASYSWSFDDGRTWSGSEDTANHSWSTPGVYNITLRVWDTASLMGQFTSPFEVLDTTRPNAVAGDDFTIAPEVGVYLNGSLSTDDVGIARAEWYITCEHGTSKWFGLVVGVRFHHEGVYNITLKVWDAAGNSDEDYLTATVVDLEPPVAVIGEDQVVPQHTTLDLNGTASTDNWMIVTWNWTISSPDDGTTYYNTSSISHTFTEAGVHTVTLRVTDPVGLWNETSINVTVIDTTTPHPVPGRDLTIDQGETLHLNGTGSWDNVGIVNWTWTVVGPGANATYHTPEANHTFPDAGVYIVTLRVEDAAGLNASAPITITVRDTEPPVADAGADVTVDEGTVVNLDPTNSTDNVGIVVYVWNFTYDGRERMIPYNAEPYRFYFEIPGVYVVTLTVRDARGNEATDQMVVTVLDMTPPEADAGENQEIDQHTTVTFRDPLSTDNMGIVNYTWTFEYDGKEQVLVGQGSAFTFDLPGVYTVTLTVADAAGHTATDTLIITVVDITPPVPDAGDDVQVEAGTTVGFNGSGSWDNVGVTRSEWTFTYNGQARSLMGTHPEFTFHIPGVYTVALVVSDEAGNTAYDTLTVTVVDTTAPVAVAGDDASVLPGGTVEFDASASTDNVGIVSYSWTFTYGGEDHTVVGPTTSFTFDTLGESVITLTVEDTSGNTATDTVTVTVKDAEPPVADAGEGVTVDQHATVAFDGSGTTDNVGVVNWKWNFTYNGTTVGLDGSSPTFTFDLAGEYLVTLFVFDGAMNVANDTLTVKVLDTESPVAVLEGDDQHLEGHPAHFDGTDSTDNVGIVSYTWTFTEGTRQLKQEGDLVTHIFEEPGVYEVTLTVEDARGNSDTDTMTVTVKEWYGDPPPEDDDEGVSLALVGGIVAAGVVAVLAVLLLMRRRS